MSTKEIVFLPFMLETQYRDYVWGGHKLRPDVAGPTAEAWIIYENDRIQSGAFTGKTLADVTKQYALEVLGTNGAARGSRFPLLIKILDCAAWLSVQVHPNDEQAKKMEGSDQNGKTEAWHIIHADPGTTLLCGLKPGTTEAQVNADVRGGKIMEIIQRLEIQTGDSLLIRAGMVHALGPGALVYEVQETSDITYRVYDWDRPASEGRKLHIEQSLEVINPVLEPTVVPPPPSGDGEKTTLVKCEYFRLEMITAQTKPMLMDTRGESFHALTLLEGQTSIQGEGWEMTLNQWQSVIVPAACGKYQITPVSAYKLLRSAVD